MKIREFKLHRPEALDEALDIFEQYGSDVAPYAGGTELLLTMKMGMLYFPHLVDMKCITGSASIDSDGDELRIGPAVTHRMIEESSLIRSRLPQLALLAQQIGNIRVRSVGTLAGALAFAEPAADPPALLIALDASVDLRSANTSRTIRLEDFLVGGYETDLKESEVISAIRVPLPRPGTRIVHKRFCVLERPTVAVAVLAKIEAGRFVESPTVVLSAIDEIPRRVSVEDISGCSIQDPQVITRAADLAAASADPVDDLAGSAEYKCHLAAVMTRRAIEGLAIEKGIT